MRVMSDTYTLRIEKSIDDLFRHLAQRASADEIKRMRSAYELAAEALRLRRSSPQSYLQSTQTLL